MHRKVNILEMNVNRIAKTQPCSGKPTKYEKCQLSEKVFVDDIDQLD
jgi:hypothetical protein